MVPILELGIKGMDGQFIKTPRDAAKKTGSGKRLERRFETFKMHAA